MGLTIHLLPRLGYREPDLKWATLMSYIYGAGQLLHIIGLLWSGGYGVQRKVAGAAQGLHGFAQTAGMGLMGLGGLIAVAGGIMFLVVVFKAMPAFQRRIPVTFRFCYSGSFLRGLLPQCYLEASSEVSKWILDQAERDKCRARMMTKK